MRQDGVRQGEAEWVRQGGVFVKPASYPLFYRPGEGTSHEPDPQTLLRPY